MGEDVLAERAKGSEFFRRIINYGCRAENYHRAVVHRVIEDGAGQDQSVEQGDRDADGDALIEVAQHAAGGRTVDVKHVPVASERSWDHERLSVNQEADVAEESFVEDLVDGVALVNRALRFAHYARAWSRSGCRITGHGADFLGWRQEW